MRRRRTNSRYVPCMIVLACVTAFCAIIAGLSALSVLLKTGGLYEQQAAQYFRSETMPYVQLSLFIDEDAGFDLFSVTSARDTVDAELLGASVAVPEDAGVGARLYVDAYSTEYSARVTTPDEEILSSGFDVKVTAVGGDFFMLHRLNFISGQPFGDGDFLTDRIVVDELCAWRLYGAQDIAGMTLLLDGKRYEIAGVVSTGDYDSYGIIPRVYIPYAAYSPDGNAALTCYELVLPEQITGFGETTAEKAVGLDKSKYVMKNNTDRYELGTLLDSLDGFFARGTRDDRIYYPHWENNALTVENSCMIVALAAAVSCGIAAAAVIVMVMASMLKLSKVLSELKEKHRR